jgi:hypothetical protein
MNNSLSFLTVSDFTQLNQTGEYYLFLRNASDLHSPSVDSTVCNLYAKLSLYLCQRLMVLQKSCKMTKFLKQNKLVTSFAIFVNSPIPRRCEAFL